MSFRGKIPQAAQAAASQFVTNAAANALPLPIVGDSYRPGDFLYQNKTDRIISFVLLIVFMTNFFFMHFIRVCIRIDYDDYDMDNLHWYDTTDIVLAFLLFFVLIICIGVSVYSIFKNKKP